MANPPSPRPPKRNPPEEKPGWFWVAIGLFSSLISRLMTIFLVLTGCFLVTALLPYSLSNALVTYAFMASGFVLGALYTIAFGIPHALHEKGAVGWYHSHYLISPVDPRNCSNISQVHLYLSGHCSAYNDGAWWAATVWDLTMQNFAARIIMEILIPIIILLIVIDAILFLTGLLSRSKNS